MIGRDPLFGLIVFVAAVIISRVAVMERALKRLDPGDKARLIDGFSGFRTYYYTSALILVVLFFASNRYFPEFHSIITPAFIISFLAMICVVTVLSYRKLKALHMPYDYVRSYLIGSCLQYVGIGFLIAPIVARYAW